MLLLREVRPIGRPAAPRLREDLRWAETQGAHVTRHNLSSDPDAFVANPKVTRLARDVVVAWQPEAPVGAAALRELAAATAVGSRCDEVRAIRDTIEARVRELVESKLDALGTDDAAHQLRLSQMVPELAEQFASHHSVEDIRARADAILVRYDDVPVRSYAATLAMRETRETRECLRKETRHALVMAR